MSNVKISELPAAVTPLVGDELVAIVQTGVTKKVSADAIASLVTTATQTFTAQQTLTGGLVIQSVAATDIAAAGNAINTINKAQGKVVYDLTNHRIMIANGSAAVDPWYVADGSASVVPS